MKYKDAGLGENWTDHTHHRSRQSTLNSYMTQPQPILHSAFHDDLSMAYSSLNNPSGSFNPASYTRAFFGSPFSWRPGSFGNRSVPSSSPTQLLGPLEYVSFFFILRDALSFLSLLAPPTSAAQERYRHPWSLTVALFSTRSRPWSAKMNS